MTARGPRELEQATAELIGAELRRAVHDEDHGLRFDWLVEELAEDAATWILDEAAGDDDSWQAQWRLLYGLTSVGSPGLGSLVENLLTQLRKELPAKAKAQQPEWLPLLPKIAATGEVWEMHDAYGTHFAVIAGFRYPGGTDPSVFLFDIDACENVRLASAGVFDDVQQAAVAWRERTGGAAAGAVPSRAWSRRRTACPAWPTWSSTNNSWTDPNRGRCWTTGSGRTGATWTWRKPCATGGWRCQKRSRCTATSTSRRWRRSSLPGISAGTAAHRIPRRPKC